MPYGTEIEYPQVQNGNEMTTFTEPAHGSHGLRSQVRDDYGGSGGWPDGYIGSDPTAGIEVRSDQLTADQLSQWYRESIVELSKYSPHEPCGVSANSRASTIGLHLHFSGPGFSEAKARELYQLSSEPWFKLFACSSLARGGQDTYQVFRSSYCGMRYTDEPSNACVNRAERGEDHWEWRMLEPVTPDHFDLVMEFMETLRNDGTDEARAFARSYVNDLDPRLTAVKRAQALDIEAEIEAFDTDDMGSRYQIDRNPIDETSEFFNAVYNASAAPYIYRARDEETGNVYYVMDSDNYTSSDSFDIGGVSFDHNSVLNATTLSSAPRSEANRLREDVRAHRHGTNNSNSRFGSTRTSDATDALVERLAATEGSN